MEFTTGEIYNTKEALASLLKERFPVRVSLKLANLGTKLQPVIQAVDMEREQLIMTYGVSDKDKPTQKRIAPGNEHFPQFAEEYGNLLAEKVDIDFEVVDLPMMVASVCPNCHQTTERELSLEPYVLAVLDKFVKVAGRMELSQLLK